ncbi:hypothetical protein MCEMRE217_00489 [Candidatus Nanopelagicaceae bacterium]
MTERETELIENVASKSAETSISAVVDLCNEFLLPRKEFAKAELLLLEQVGLQTISSGNVIELTLAKTYIGLEELPRAKRFLEVVISSSSEQTSAEAKDLLASMQSSS